MTFAQWLRRERKAAGLTQVELARHAEIGRTYVTALESGSVLLPTSTTRQAIHHVLGTSDAELIDLGIMAIDPYTNEEYAPKSATMIHGETASATIRAHPATVHLRESRPVYDDVNPFARDDPRWHFVETIKRVDLTNREQATLLYAVGQLLLLLDMPPDVLAKLMEPST